MNSNRITRMTELGRRPIVKNELIYVGITR